jgi:chitinase
MDKLRPNLVLTFASAGWQKYFDHIELAEVMKYVDYMNIMTYDLSGPSSPLAMHHTNLFGLPYAQIDEDIIQSLNLSEESYESRSVDDIVTYCLAQGVKSEQLVIGAAFYGKSWRGVHPDNNGLYQSHKGFKGFYSYQQIKDLLNTNEANRFWDEQGQAPFIYQAVDSIFITYDDPQSLELKVNYAKDKKLGGIMFWQLRSDNKEFELTAALRNAMDTE